MTCSPRPLLGVTLLLLLTAGPARADLIPWIYNWSRSPAAILADAPGTGYVTLTDESSKLAVGDSNIVATNLKTFSTATLANKDTFTNKAYSITLTLTDVNTNESGTLTFTGRIDGWLTAQSSYLQNTFTGLTTQQLVLGQSVYTVTAPTYTPPGIPGSDNSGSISTKVLVKVEALVAQVPEPGALALAGVGLAAVAAARRRQRQRERAIAAAADSGKAKIPRA